MEEFINEQEILKTARRMSFYLLKNTIVTHFNAREYNSMSNDSLSQNLTKHSDKLMDIFIQAAWERRPAAQNYFCGIEPKSDENSSEDVSLDEYKKDVMKTLKKVYKN